MLRVIVALAFVLALPTEAATAPDGATATLTGTLSGTVTYRQRSALPPEAMLIVKLEDVSRPGAPALVLAENTIAFAGRQVPIPFELTYNPAAVIADHQYSVRAAIKVADHLVFMSTQAYPVLTRGAPTKVTVDVSPLPTHAPNAPVETTYWKLTELGGKSVASASRTTEAHLILRQDGHRLAGSTGCAPLAGSYTVKRSRIELKPETTTACAPLAQKQADALLDALKGANRYRIDHNTLELRRGKDVLARFEAQYKR